MKKHWKGEAVLEIVLKLGLVFGGSVEQIGGIFWDSVGVGIIFLVAVLKKWDNLRDCVDVGISFRGRVEKYGDCFWGRVEECWCWSWDKSFNQDEIVFETMLKLRLVFQSRWDSWDSVDSVS